MCSPSQSHRTTLPRACPPSGPGLSGSCDHTAGFPARSAQRRPATGRSSSSIDGRGLCMIAHALAAVEGLSFSRDYLAMRSYGMSETPLMASTGFTTRGLPMRRRYGGGAGGRGRRRLEPRGLRARRGRKGYRNAIERQGEDGGDGIRPARRAARTSFGLAPNSRLKAWLNSEASVKRMTFITAEG